MTGSLACGISMVLVAAGVGVSASATGMAAMSAGSADGPHGLLGHCYVSARGSCSGSPSTAARPPDVTHADQ
ncbi:MAG: hypothetical protein H0V07_11270 [Propionibacteriales bacterium]|nr:hypothetical protein [Propionibacteriales bacterium]